MTIGSLFAGIGGLELGLERAGLGPVVWQVEQDEFCRAVLAKHWPDADRSVTDVCEANETNLAKVDVVCGGFPCQDLSFAGRGAGLRGERSGLWFEYLRVIEDLRPRYVVIENVPALLQRGFDVVLRGLADVGYDAEWSVVSACSVGAPHVRRRLFVVAYTNGEHGAERVWDTDAREERALPYYYSSASARLSWRARMEDPSALYGGANGVPRRVDRLRALGNAVVPQCAELVGWIVRNLDGGNEDET